jgi:acetoin utilization protein AcuB
MIKKELKNQMSRNLLTVKESTTVGEAYHLMINEWIRHLPVVSEDEQTVVGILSDRDLLCAKSHTLPVKSVMSPHVRSCEVTTPIKQVVHTMIDNKISSCLITDKDVVQGIVTSEDMLILLSQLLNKEDDSQFVVQKWIANPVTQNAINMLSQAGI